MDELPCDLELAVLRAEPFELQAEQGSYCGSRTTPKVE